jgi:amino-acid N-acetyltransferase
MTVDRALIADVPRIKGLTDGYADSEIVLRLDLSDIYERLANYIVARDDTGEVVGCVNLTVFDQSLAEVRSLVVSPDHQRRGLGRDLMTELISRARRLGVPKLFALTYAVDFFLSLGFARGRKADMPQKIWKDCIKCPKFPVCDEVLLEKTL